MKQIIRQISFFLVILVFLAGTTGVSFYIHECSSSNTKEVFVYPEISNKTASCCCAVEMHSSVAGSEKAPSFNETGCCKNTHVYLKAAFSGFPVIFQFHDELNISGLPTDFLSILHDRPENDMADFVLLVDHPPPRSGKALIHFLHQIKIPASVS